LILFNPGEYLLDLQITKSICFIGIVSIFIVTLSFMLPYSLQQPYDVLQQLFATSYIEYYDETGNNALQHISASTEEEGFKNKNKNKTILQSYQNLNYGIKVQYPDNWTFSEENGSIVRFGEQQKYLQLDDGSFISFYSPLKNDNDTYLANLRIYAKDLPSEIEKLSNASHLSLLDLYAIYFLHMLKYSNFTIAEPIKKTMLGIDNKSAIKIRYTTGDAQTQQSVLDVFTLYNNKIYGLRYTSELNEYSKYLPVINAMINSFEIKTKKENEDKIIDGPQVETKELHINNPSDFSRLTVTNNIGNSFIYSNSSSTSVDSLKNYALSKINEDRQDFGKHPVNLSLNSAAQYQAENILSTKYMSHLTTKGEKPYMLYSELGGYGKLRQNIAFIGDPYLYGKCIGGEIDCKKINPLKTIDLLEDIMVYNDAHAKWHHRYNILDNYTTHASLGIAYDDYSFALVQNFENNYINFSPIHMKNGDKHVKVSGTLLNDTRFYGVEIYYDNLPTTSFYEQYKDPDKYQPGNLIATVKAATNVGFATGISNSNLEKNSTVASLSNIVMISPLKESYSFSENKQAISLEFDILPLIKEKKSGVYTIVVVLEDLNHNVFPGGAHSIFHDG
jgi:uncharacterized protein YkwD